MRWCAIAGNVEQASTDDGSTPLFMAAFEGHEAVVRCLVMEGGANVNRAQPSSGMTGLQR